MERPITDFLYVHFDREFENETESGLLIDTEDYASEEDPSREKIQHRRIWGTVIRTPMMLDETKLELVDPGMPWPRRTFTGEYLQQQVRMNPRSKPPQYSCALFEPKFITLADYPMVVQEGDKVYVHHDAFDKPLAPGIFMIRYDSVICTVRDGETIMCTDHNLITPKLLPDQDIYSQAGLLLMLGKENRVPLRGYTSAGEEIVYMPDADWVNRIEGKDYYVVKTKDIIMDSNMKPRGNRVVLEFDPAALETDGGILVPEVARLKERPARGKVLATGPLVSGLEIGETAVFAAGAGVIVQFDDRDVLVLTDGDIFGTV